jgi:ribosomal protein S18 acetylase RimI-like enzyme
MGGNQLVREHFVPDEHLDLVQVFDCGDEPYQLTVSNWLKCQNSDDSAKADIEAHNTEVWLYFNEHDELIGMGSMGLTRWTIPPEKKKVDVVLIPMLGVIKKYWGQPPGSTYADQIMDDLQAESLRYAGSHKALVLAVHPANERGIAFYTRRGFVTVEPAMNDGHLRMALFNLDRDCDDQRS